MKVKIECNSPLLQKSLEFFLKEYIDKNGILITDNPEKEGILIGKDIKKPFSKSNLLLQLENIIKTNSSFENELEKLLNKFTQELKTLIKEYCGKG